ncbi:hypothetical protein ABE607_04885 [Comamonas aquatica]|jgi:hypothetical protein|uniref:Uncharacterized protein n=2 Tax=Comamonas aquatica TaxID=225991 RepID=A0A014MUD8_9BURK|nr:MULTISPECIES: hypothetical protein [Comamonas]ANY61196.1 hypothetical protein MA05_02665 [Comamonas aquatica]EXU81679.1 hypothetical protein AX13_07690 [Comamonas aquatica DA1877]MDE1556042.1 hypothetical protein [Comamonas aquatica]MDH0200212.1 hypothetical protein [Comamonas aquatica]MDH0362143.1 hypothetical protein [Comamonas aquatica]
MTAHTDALLQLQALDDALLRLEDGSLSAAQLNDQARAAHALLAALPERYGPVLLQLLDRLESSALFTEESCSFSQSDLHTHLHGWMAKARAQLVD